MISLITQLILRNTLWVGATSIWYGYSWIFPSKKDKINNELYKKVIEMNNRNEELHNDLKSIKNMIRADLNIPEPVNMEEYIYVIKTNIEKMSASKEIKY